MHAIPDLSSEFEFATARSSGPGGQNVNKLETKVELRFDIQNSELINAKTKKLLLVELKNKLTKTGILIVTDQSSRSQAKNKSNCIQKIYEMLNAAITEEKERIPIGIPEEVNEKRLKSKKIISEKKISRKIDFNTDE